jgi:hypothetical protein
VPRAAARRDVARAAFLGAAAVLAVSLAACGSQLDPNQVADANGGTAANVQAGGAAVPGAGGGGDPTTTGSGSTTTTSSGGASSGSGTTAVGGTTASAGSAGGGSSSAGGGGGSSTSGGGHGGGTGAAGAAASCDGFKNGPGITDDEITIGNSSDISGPVPGLFESSQDAV